MSSFSPDLSQGLDTTARCSDGGIVIRRAVDVKGRGAAISNPAPENDGRGRPNSVPTVAYCMIRYVPS